MEKDITIAGARPYAEVRKDCHAVKQSRTVKDRTLTRCARRIAASLPEGEWFLVPAPSHRGKAEDSLLLATAIATEYNRLHDGFAVVCNILECEPHPSLCDEKHAGRDVSCVDIRVRLKDVPVAYALSLRTDLPAWLVDNVVDTGRTARACMRALPPLRGVIAVGDTGAHRS